jgi:hypothetical protein
MPELPEVECAAQQALGHASIETTQRCARMPDEIVRREAERIAEGSGGP